MYAIFLLIAPFFGVILAGYLFTRLKIASPAWTETLNSYVVRIGYPSVIFYALAKSPIQFSEHSQLLLLNSVYLIVCFVFAWTISRVFGLSKQLRRTLFICLPYGNVAYLGLPVLTEVFGQQIIPQVSLIISVYLILTFSLGIFYLEKTAKPEVDYRILVSGLVKNPLLIGVFLGIIASFFGLRTDSIFLKVVDIIGKSTTAVIMLSLGIFISQVKFGKWKEWINVSVFTLTKILVLPALFIWMLRISGISIQSNLPSILEAAMPFALTPYALAEVYNLDKNFITKAIVLSTILSIITLPFWSISLK